MTFRTTVWAASLAFATASCATAVTSSPTSPVSPTTSLEAPATTLDAVEAAAAYRSCMEEHGVTVGSVPFDATGRPRLELVIPDTDLSDPAQVGAMSACAWHLAQGALSLATEPVLRVALMESLAQFSGCVRDHGVGGFPDPVPEFSGIGAPYREEAIPYSDPGLPAALESCRLRLADRG